MADYLITYDLHVKGQKYEEIAEEIESIGTCIHPMLSVWFVNTTTMNAKDIRDALKKHLDSNDKVFVTSIGDWAGVRTGAADWLNS